MIFPCNRCGLCCRHLEQIPQLANFDSGNGRCIHLLDNNLCGIYEERPDICNVSKMYEQVYVEFMSETDYIKMNIDGCSEIKKKYFENIGE